MRYLATSHSPNLYMYLLRGHQTAYIATLLQLNSLNQAPSAAGQTCQVYVYAGKNAELQLSMKMLPASNKNFFLLLYTKLGNMLFIS